MILKKWLKYGLIVHIVSSILVAMLFILSAVLNNNSISGSFYLLGLLFFIPTVLAGMVAYFAGLLEVFTSKKTTGSKALWIIGMLMFNTLGTLLYYFTGRNDLAE